LDHIGLGASPAAALAPGFGAGFGVPDNQRCGGNTLHRRLSSTHQFSKFGEERGEWAGSQWSWLISFRTMRVDSEVLNETAESLAYLDLARTQIFC
jgi:hypothetical protein